MQPLPFSHTAGSHAKPNRSITTAQKLAKKDELIEERLVKEIYRNFNWF